VPEGGVFGFLGPNGAGKTDDDPLPARPRVGERRTDAGDGRRRAAPPALGDRAHRLDRRDADDVPALHGPPEPGDPRDDPGRQPNDREEVLETVGLAERADDRVRTYSLGMKQRLGIAAALLKDPALLILDEPANGLDPAGIVEVRELVQRLGGEGRTVFVSSHILSEIQHTADRVAIIARGRLVKEGLVREVLARGGAEGLIVRVEDLAAGVRALADAGIDSVADDGVLHVRVPATEASDVTRALAGRGIFLSELRPDELDLETVFLELTKDEGPGS
jgi:ABC-2 type transport system ATP-binding protein